MEQKDIEKLQKELKEHVCYMPFTYLSPFEAHVDPCCGDWITLHIPYDPTGKTEGSYKSLVDVWTSKQMKALRQSVLDGSYRFCTDKCPYKIGLLRGFKTNFVSKEKVRENSKEWDIEHPPLRHLKFCSDITCNLYCKTCRPSRMSSRGIEIRNQIEDIESSEIRESLQRIDLLGSGDPFVSKPAREWLFNFDPKKYPSLQDVHIHSNGQLWTKQNHERMGDVIPYIHTLEISIDAATKETYEKVRRGGSWERLQENLKERILRLPNLRDITFSFVIQRLNYKEIEQFYFYVRDTIFSINPNLVVFIRMSPAEHWRATKEEYSTEIDVRNNPKIWKEVVRQIEEVRKLALKDRIRLDSGVI